MNTEILEKKSAHSGPSKRLSVSICMATYNGARYLREQIDSILTEMRPGDELVISDDGSTDATGEILKSYGPVLRLVGSSRVGGVVQNFSRALSQARGELILLSDQDDVWLPGRLAIMCSELEHCELVLTNAVVVDEQLQPTGFTLFDQVRPSVGFWRNLLRRNSFVGCCIGFRRSLLVRALPLPAGTPWHDWLLGLLACMHGRVRQLETPLLLYRRHGENASLTGQASRNGVLRKVLLRCQVLRALAICSWRSTWQGV